MGETTGRVAGRACGIRTFFSSHAFPFMDTVSLIIIHVKDLHGEEDGSLIEFKI
jgi:hypothetical protein